MKPPELWVRMRAHANTMPEGPARTHVLKLAQEFETAVRAWNNQTATSREMLGKWAECRRCFADVGGESLI